MSLTVWVIYDHPKDYPDYWVARKFEDDQPTDNVLLCEDLAGLRRYMRKRRLICVNRAESDDPVIVETWC